MKLKIIAGFVLVNMTRAAKPQFVRPVILYPTAAVAREARMQIFSNGSANLRTNPREMRRLVRVRHAKLFYE